MSTAAGSANSTPTNSVTPTDELGGKRPSVCARCGREHLITPPPEGCPECETSAGTSTDAGKPLEVEPLGHRVTGGMWWYLSGAMTSKVATSIAQVFLGWLLDKEHFGLFATAAAVAGMCNLLRDAGAHVMLVQRARQYETLSGPLFWMGMTASLVSAGLMMLAAWPLSHLVYERYHAPDELIPLFLVIACAWPMQVPSQILIARLRGELRFSTVTKIYATSAIARQVSMVVLAWLGFGAMSFAIPYVICAVLEAVLAYLATRDAVWMRPKGFHLWRSHFQHGKWVVFSNFCNLALDQGSFAVLGLMLNDAVLGVYYFAYQMLAQIGVLLSAGFQQILFPIMSRLADQPERQREAMKKSLHAVMMTGSFGCLLLAVLFDPLEKLVWHGKWADATPAIMILGLFFPWRVTFGVTTASVLARGRFKPLAFKTLFEGVGLMGAVAIGAHLDPTPSGIALFAGAWLMISRLTVIFFVLQAMGLNALTVVPAITPSWLMAIGAAASAFFLEQWLNLGGLLERELLDPGASQTVRTVVRNVPRLVVIGATYVMLYTALLRLLMPRQLTQAVGVLPMRARLVLERALRLRSVAA